MVEFCGDIFEEVCDQGKVMIVVLEEAGLGYVYFIVEVFKIKQAWDLCKVGFGFLANIFGDVKFVACIEDIVVDIKDLFVYIKEFDQFMANFGQQVVYYVYVGVGEFYFCFIFDFKKVEGQCFFYEIIKVVVELVKKYNGFLSGEYGDGWVCVEFIFFMIGEYNYEYLCQIK